MPKTPYVDFKAVKQAVSMVQILDHYLLTDRFKPSGDSLSGPCPLHNGEGSTQFRVSISKNCWHCFSDCKAGGNILDFVSRKENISIREAAIRIAEWFNLSFTKPVRNKTAKSDGEEVDTQQDESEQPLSRGSEVNKPLGFQLQNLDARHPYLTERGLTPESIAEFGLGLCSKGSMAGRIVIPIHNLEGQIVAYAGRWPGEPPEGQPKYKLPPGFKKSLEVFNLHRAVQADPEQPLVIVEGFFDCIALWQQGVRRVVALMGSSLSPVQQELIAQHTGNRVVLLFDEDDAGRLGREQCLPKLAAFIFVKSPRLPQEGQQPDGLSADEIQELCLS